MSASWTIFWAPSKKPKGRWVLKFAAGKGSSQKLIPELHCATSTSRKAWAASFLANTDFTGTLPRDGKRKGEVTIRDRFDPWMTLRGGRIGRADSLALAPSTVKDNRSIFNKWILAAVEGDVAVEGDTPIPLADEALNGISVARLRRWLRAVRGKCASNTCRNVAATLRTFFDDAMAEGWTSLPANPMRHPGVDAELPRGESLSEGEILAIPDVAARALVLDERIQAHRRVRYLLAFSLGLRDGELAGLRWGSVELEDGLPVVRIARAIRLYGEGGHVEEGALKTRSSKKLLPLPRVAVEALRWWGTVGWPAWAGRPWTPEDRILAQGPQGSRPDSAEILREDLATLGAPTTGHAGLALCFRHTRGTFASWLEAAGVDQPTRQRWLRHAGANVTERSYTRGDLERMGAEASRSIRVTWRDPEEKMPVQDGKIRCNFGCTCCTETESNRAILGIRTPDLRFTKPLDNTTPDDPRRHNECLAASGARESSGQSDTSDQKEVQLGPRCTGLLESLKGDLETAIVGLQTAGLVVAPALEIRFADEDGGAL